MRRPARDLLKKLGADGWYIVTDPQLVYWAAIWPHSIAIRAGIDPRDRGRRKPIILRREREEILVEYDYGHGGYIAHNAQGDILSSGGSQFDALLTIAYR